MIDFRIKLVSRLIPILALFIVFRLFYWQIIRGEELAIQASKQYQDTVRLFSQRGQIVDAQGNILAGTRNLYELFVYKPSLSNPNTSELVDKLGPILTPEVDIATSTARLFEDRVKETKLQLLDRFNLKSNWISLKHYLTPSQKEQVEALGEPGLGFNDEFVRFYPEASLSAQLLGFVGKDQIGKEKGYFGLEGYFDRELQGREGVVRMEKDAVGRPILIGRYEHLENLEGRSIGTTIDRRMQYIAESLLNDGLERYEATSGGVIIMESKTGKVRAMASLPSYDPANFSKFDQHFYANTNVANLFEPGSTFKVLVMAAGFNESVVSPDTQCDICSGPVVIGKYSIKTWNEEYHPGSTMTDVIRNSDNTGMVFVGRKLGPEKLLEYLDQFGFGKKTNLGIEEEVGGQLKQLKNIGDIDLATMTFGQGIAVTPIQLVSAVNTIANGGVYTPPILADRLIDGEKEIPLPPPPTRTVLTPRSVKDITNIMVTAVRQGEAKWAVPKNINIAGKTGTAQIPIEGHYDKEKTIASFVGFFPAENPRYTMLVTLKEPKTSPWGSETAAPLWFSIAKQLILF